MHAREGEGKLCRRQGKTFELAVVAGALAIALFQLIVPPSVGLANNGDFSKVKSLFSIGDPAEPDLGYRYFVPRYSVDSRRYYFSGQLSSEQLLTGVAYLVNSVVSKDGWFDLRVLGIVHTAVFLLVVWTGLRRFRRHGLPVRLVLAAAVLLVLSDVGYIAYFNSFYCEAASFLFLLLALVAALEVLCCPRRRLPWLAAFAASSALFSMAKPQNFIGGLLLAGVALSWAWLGQERSWRRACAASAACIVLVTLVYQSRTPKFITRPTLYVALFYELLAHSPAPEADLRELGLPTDLAKYSGTHPWSPGVPAPIYNMTDPALARFSLASVAGFYLKHPQRAIQSLDRSAVAALLARPMLGNFTKDLGFPEYAKSRAFSLWSRGKQAFVPHSVLGVALWLAAFALIILWYMARARTIRRRLRAVLFGALWLVGVTQFVLVALLQGIIDTARHMFLFNLLFDVALVTLIWLMVAYLPRLAARVPGLVSAWSPSHGRPVGRPG